MDLEIVTVGTELLLGLTVDTNSAKLSRALASAGARVVRRCTVGDDAGAIRQTVDEALRRTRFVIVTGGLGPTHDDVTKRAVAELFDAPLELDETYLADLERRFAALGRGDFPPSNRSQAEIPRGATVLRNPRGPAPGLWLEGRRGTTVLLPGVPHEMHGILEEALLPKLAERIGSTSVIRSRTLRTTGITESALASRLASLTRDLDPVTLAFLPGPSGVDLRLTAWDLPATRADQELERAAGVLMPALGDRCYGEDDDDLAGVVLSELRARGWLLSVAESCTGGVVAARLTAVPGASDTFQGGVVCYSNESKVRDLGVDPEAIARHGAVSESVAAQMVRGVVERFGTEAGIAVTGIAGPTGGTPENPVGTVWLAALADGRTRVLQRRFPGGRERVRQRSAQAALDLLRMLSK